MASKRGVAATLGLLSRAFAGVVDEAKIDLYYGAWSDLTDEQLLKAVTVVVRTWTGAFIPPPAILREAIAPAPVAVDSETILRKISRLGSYNPNTGWNYPSVEKVRDELGESIAYAYVAGGRQRLFSDNDVTRDIALREFEESAKLAIGRASLGLPIYGGNDVGSALGEGTTIPRLRAG